MRRALLLAGVALGLAAPTAGAGSGAAERWFAGQVATVGAGHAAEHRAAARAARAHRTPRRRARSRVVFDVPPASQVGRWLSPRPVAGHPIHAVLLPTGKVLYFSYPLYTGAYAPTKGDAWVWDPKTDEHTPVPPPPDVRGNGGEPAQIFCGGQSLLADGRVLVAGGTLDWEKSPLYYKGHWFTHVFDPWTLTWERGPEMRRGRWYPSQLLLGDASTLLVAGYADDGATLNADLERFDAAGPGTITKVGELIGELYPHLTQMTDGRVAVTGPGNGSDGPFRDDSSLVDPVTGAVTDLAPMNRTRIGSTKIRWPAGPGESGQRVTVLGGLGGSSTSATTTQESIDFAQASPAFEETPALNVRRSYHATSWLPDGSLVTVGGGAGKPQGSLFDLDADVRQHQVELFDPVSRTWRLGPAQMHDRAYHSVALMLPDATIWSSGDDDPRDGKDRESYERYEPPFLHRGARPKIGWAPTRIGRGRRFALRTASAEPVVGASLVAPSAVTHAVDMNGRYTPLTVEPDPAQPGRLLVDAPSDRTAFPPGYYMLFALTADGVPSEASWIRLDESGDVSPDEPTAPAGPVDERHETTSGPSAEPGPTRSIVRPAARRWRLKAATARRSLARGWLWLPARTEGGPATVTVHVGGRVAARKRLRSDAAARVRLARWTAARGLRTRAVTITVRPTAP